MNNLIEEAFKEDLITLQTRYPLVPKKKIMSLQQEFGSIMTDCILKDDYHLYVEFIEAGGIFNE